MYLREFGGADRPGPESDHPWSARPIGPRVCTRLPGRAASRSGCPPRARRGPTFRRLLKHFPMRHSMPPRPSNRKQHTSRERPKRLRTFQPLASLSLFARPITTSADRFAYHCDVVTLACPAPVAVRQVSSPAPTTGARTCVAAGGRKSPRRPPTGANGSRTISVSLLRTAPSDRHPLRQGSLTSSMRIRCWQVPCH